MDEVTATLEAEEVCGESAPVIRVAVVDAHGHPREFSLSTEAAEELAAQLTLAVAA